MTALVKINLLAFIGIIGAIILFFGEAYDYLVYDPSTTQYLLLTVRKWVVFITVAMTLIYCSIRLVRRHYAITRKRLIPMAFLYILTAIIYLICQLWVTEGFPVISFTGLFVGYAGCVICAFMVLPRGDNGYQNQQMF